MDIIGKMHDFDFVSSIQRQPKLIFAEQRFCFHCLFALVADCLYGLHTGYGTPAVRAMQAETCPAAALTDANPDRGQLGRNVETMWKQSQCFSWRHSQDYPLERDSLNSPPLATKNNP
jgi:hypothetical protein